MDLEIGSNTFLDVKIPVLWGTRAILQDSEGRVSVIDLSGDTAVVEVLGDRPAPNVEYYPISGDAFEVIQEGKPIYTYMPHGRILSSTELRLPDIEIREDAVRVGSNIYSDNVILGAEIGIAVTEKGSTMGSPVPKKLADLVLED